MSVPNIIAMQDKLLHSLYKVKEDSSMDNTSVHVQLANRKEMALRALSHRLRGLAG